MRCRTAVALPLLVAASLLGACLMPRYLAQAVSGQLWLLHRGRPIDQILADPDTDERTRLLLTEVEPIKEFGASYGLRLDGNYTRYVELEAPAVVWFVGASDRLSFEPRTACFPIAGCFPGLGWFDREEARRYRDEMERDGYDSHMRPASAYSTGGWFHDPLLSSMLSPEEDAFAELANVLLHELTHVTRFIPDQTYFNEGEATWVGDALTNEWLTRRFGDASPEMAAWRASQAERLTRVERLLAAYEELEKLYASSLPRAEKLARKATILDAAVADLHLTWRPNNASLIELRTYRAGRGIFEKLHQACGGDLKRTIAELKSVEASDFREELQENLAPVLARHEGRCRAAAAQRRGRVRSAVGAQAVPGSPKPQWRWVVAEPRRHRAHEGVRRAAVGHSRI